MNNVERFRRVMNFENVDRLPRLEIMPWWDLTLDRWRKEGLLDEPEHYWEIAAHLGLDSVRNCSGGVNTPPVPEHGATIVHNISDYERLLPEMYARSIIDIPMLDQAAELHDSGNLVTGLHLYGFFWTPRVLFGIEPHLYAFYDQPDLMKRINRDLLEFNCRIFEEFLSVLTPDYVLISEDMAYNHGAMCSEEMFDRFILPYYRDLIPLPKKKEIPVFVDCDGMIESMIPWLRRAGVDGILPLERMAGVDVNRIRKNHPDFLMIGGFDKTVMKRGPGAMREEFERILPAMKSGGFVPSVDHQTPPDVSLENYRAYVKLLKEYTEKAAIACQPHMV